MSSGWQFLDQPFFVRPRFEVTVCLTFPAALQHAAQQQGEMPCQKGIIYKIRF